MNWLAFVGSPNGAASKWLLMATCLDLEGPLYEGESLRLRSSFHSSVASSMTPTTAREFAERLLLHCVEHNPRVCEGCELVRDYGRAQHLIEADREAIRREALEPFRALAEEFAAQGNAMRWRPEHDIHKGAALAYEGCAERLASLLPPAEKAGPT
jgi:hypothetical protein